MRHKVGARARERGRDLHLLRYMTVQLHRLLVLLLLLSLTLSCRLSHPHLFIPPSAQASVPALRHIPPSVLFMSILHLQHAPHVKSANLQSL